MANKPEHAHITSNCGNCFVDTKLTTALAGDRTSNTSRYNGQRLQLLTLSHYRRSPTPHKITTIGHTVSDNRNYGMLLLPIIIGPTLHA